MGIAATNIINKTPNPTGNFAIIANNNVVSNQKSYVIDTIGIDQINEMSIKNKVTKNFGENSLSNDYNSNYLATQHRYFNL
jgi:hypothetical protein